MSSSTSKAPITLYTAATPNGWKVTIALEELGIPYELKSLDISTNVQKEEWFLKINPNGRIPAIIDHKHGDFPIFESGAILLWLGEHYDPEHKLWPADPKLQSEVTQWIMFQMGGIGPMQGQAGHFRRSAPEVNEYGITRYTNETRRLYGVLERRLANQDYLVNNQYSLADIINFSWVACHGYAEIDISDLPNVQAWMKRILARPAVPKGMRSPGSPMVEEILKKANVA
ncbi:Glutathione S-transferase 2 [Dimargaris cristalligena]|uniref:Glutathione S-transferase n=1 Tax=Dimargaris cristalligena TaxID=215637 RepID=A0A4Q0A0R1_9FUNG|nr:Glutathione S-transferase 2 [Dimargaris cristalligena]RKP39686.1 glutathione S-transferase [Dimargaris cristalligena]|eukprot:RKP39686.1 glutathione S-transferase [Dimargaris cristalligena]